jgi:hypothetical protein
MGRREVISTGWGNKSCFQLKASSLTLFVREILPRREKERNRYNTISANKCLCLLSLLINETTGFAQSAAWHDE